MRKGRSSAAPWPAPGWATALLALSLFASPAWAQQLPASRTLIPAYFTYAIADHDLGPYTLNADGLADTAIIQAKWALSNPAPGLYDWTTLDKKIADWTGGNPAKRVIIRVAPYTGDCDRGTPYGDNDGTPGYVYRTVPRLTFDGGGVCKTKTDTTLPLSVPEVWAPAFLPLYEAFITALAARYNADPRVAGVQIGFGHLGTWNAQPSSGGGAAFASEGWTQAVWELYCLRVMDLYRAHVTKPLLIRTSSAFLAGQHCGALNRRSCALSANPELGKRLVGAAAWRGISVFLSGLGPVPSPDALVAVLTTFLGTLRPPAGFTLVYGDDFPLWVPPDRRACPGPTCGRDDAGFDRALGAAVSAWASIGRKYPMAIAWLEPEASTTNRTYAPCKPGETHETKCFRPTVAAIAAKWLGGAP